jgi:hypothetical protein
MNDLERYFNANTGNQISKWKHYFEIYDRHFSHLRGTDVHLVEIGVAHGGSLKMWKHYFGPRARIFGIDFEPRCKQFEEAQIEIFIGAQDDRQFLKSLRGMIPRIDILIDDGGHMMNQQTSTFEELFPSISAHGIYLCEDLHTSYWPAYGGGYRNPGSFVEYSKRLIDYLNAWHSIEPDALSVSDFTRTTHSLHYYDSVLVVEKRPIEKPAMTRTGRRVL